MSESIYTLCYINAIRAFFPLSSQPPFSNQLFNANFLEYLFISRIMINKDGFPRNEQNTV